MRTLRNRSFRIQALLVICATSSGEYATLQPRSSNAARTAVANVVFPAPEQPTNSINIGVSATEMKPLIVLRKPSTRQSGHEQTAIAAGRYTLAFRTTIAIAEMKVAYQWRIGAAATTVRRPWLTLSIYAKRISSLASVMVLRKHRGC